MSYGPSLVLLQGMEELPYIDRRGMVLPNILVFDENGKTFPLFECLDLTPIILLPIYTSCPHSCSAITEGWKTALEQLDEPGKSVTVIIFSFDHHDTPADLRSFRQRWQLSKESWYIISSDSIRIDSLLNSIGMSVQWDSRSKIYTHPNLAVIVTSSGVISSYYVGVFPRPEDIRTAITAALRNQPGQSWLDQAWLQCFTYNPVTGELRFDVSLLIHLLAGLLILGLLLRFLLYHRSTHTKI